MSQPFTRFTGAVVYLDTMIPYALLRGLDLAAQALFTRVQAGEIFAYTSALTFDELAYRLLLALIRDHYGGSPLDRLRSDEENIIAQFYPRIAPHLTQLQSFPNLTVVEVTASDIEVMNNLILRYHLKPRDALHVAAMQKINCVDLISHDAGFDRIPGLQRYMLI